MKPSFLRACAKDSLSLDAGMSVWSCRAMRALRMRVSISAIGSVVIALALPAGLLYAGQMSHQGELAEADAAQPEGAKVGAGAPAAVAAVAVPHPELGPLMERLLVQRLACHCSSSSAVRRACPTAPAAACPPHPFWLWWRWSPEVPGHGRPYRIRSQGI